MRTVSLGKSSLGPTENFRWVKWDKSVKQIIKPINGWAPPPTDYRKSAVEVGTSQSLER